MNEIIKLIPEMKTGQELMECMGEYPDYLPEVKEKSSAERLIALSDIYDIYIPSQMSVEIYHKLYMGLMRSLQKKSSIQAVHQQYENCKGVRGRKYQGSILGGSDSFSIIGASGIGKSSTVFRAVRLITEKDVIEMENPYLKIAPCIVVQCPFDSSVKGLLWEILRKVDEVLGSRYYHNAVRARATTDMLIGNVSQVALQHIGLLVVDEIQNVVNSRNGKQLVGMLTQLINNSGISICMVGTPESIVFFEQAMQLARRSLGLQYEAMEFDKDFIVICKVLWGYLYTKSGVTLTDGIIEWLYEHSGGNISILVALIHDAQEISILEGREVLDITLSVGQLTTGITIPEWSAVLMLSNVKSPALYMQAAFRAQNPCLYKTSSGYARKENAYVFDFDPARTLTIFEEFANDLSADTSAGRGDVETRKEHIKELLNFFPVIGEDENGELIELDAEKVLTIPRKIRSVEVVRRGFMSNFLFQNISQVFGAPQAVMDILSNFDAVGEPNKKVTFSEEVKEDLSLNEDGEVEVPDSIILGVSNDIFGEKIFAPSQEEVVETVSKIVEKPDRAESVVNKLKTDTHNQVTAGIISEAKNAYGSEMKPADKKKLESKINSNADKLIDKTFTNYNIDKNIVEQERSDALKSRHESGRSTEEINAEFDKKVEQVTKQFQETLQTGLKDLVEESKKEVVKTVETNKREREKSVIEEGIRNHLRGFSRTIPSFLMAYGNDKVTLATFDTVIPDKVFKEVTSITLDQFRFLRDGGSYEDPETGEQKEFSGQLFDPVVFDDSVKEFLALKKKLADYFDEKSVEDIFDYIPPQKTNQIFTPKKMVKKMVDMLEEENPGCFDLPDKTFIDLYMKSGLYIAEIVKRLYQSDEMKRLYPDKYDRLKHIFEKQVYGLAPTEIIYKIATSYILGFDEDVKITHHNFKQVDALPYAKDGSLQKKLDEIYGD